MLNKLHHNMTKFSIATAKIMNDLKIISVIIISISSEKLTDMTRCGACANTS